MESKIILPNDEKIVIDDKEILDFCKKVSEHREVIEFLHNYPTNTFIINFCY